MTISRLLAIVGGLLLAAGVAMLANAGKHGRAAAAEAQAKMELLINQGAVDVRAIEPRIPAEYRLNPAEGRSRLEIGAWLTEQSGAGYTRRELTGGVGVASLGLIGLGAAWWISRRKT
jgi:hypothetical protein